MVSREEELRSSGILDKEEQLTAQALYDLARAKGGELREETEKGVLYYVGVTGEKKRSQSMSLTEWSNGGFDVSLRRGRKGWQYDGGYGETGGIGDSSIVGGDRFKLTREQKDAMLHGMTRRFLPQNFQR